MGCLDAPDAVSRETLSAYAAQLRAICGRYRALLAPEDREALAALVDEATRALRCGEGGEGGEAGEGAGEAGHEGEERREWDGIYARMREAGEAALGRMHERMVGGVRGARGDGYGAPGGRVDDVGRGR
ncbi:hypothetical protein Q5752_000383 [Cryptotrichosporon argae]